MGNRTHKVGTRNGASRLYPKGEGHRDDEAASPAGILLGFGILYSLIFIGKAILSGFNEDRFAGWIMFPLLATVLVAAQWLVLRENIPRSGWWILATAAGLPAGIALAEALLKHSIMAQIDRGSGTPSPDYSCCMPSLAYRWDWHKFQSCGAISGDLHSGYWPACLAGSCLALSWAIQ